MLDAVQNNEGSEAALSGLLFEADVGQHQDASTVARRQDEQAAQDRRRVDGSGGSGGGSGGSGVAMEEGRTAAPTTDVPSMLQPVHTPPRGARPLPVQRQRVPSGQPPSNPERTHPNTR